MPNRRRTLVVLPLPLCLTAGVAAAFAAGCGGAGTTLGGPQAANLQTPSVSQAGSGGPRSASEAAAKAAAAPQTRLGLFVSAGAGDGNGEFAPDYEHVWATVRKVELLDQAEQATTVFSDDAGRALDLKALAGGRTGDGRAALLSAAPLASTKAHQRVRVTLGKSLLLFGPGDSAAKSVDIGPPAALDAEGNPTLTFSLGRARNLGTGKEDLVVSFGALSVREDKAVVTLREDDDASRRLSDAASQEPATFVGMVSGLVQGDAPGAVSFTVTGADGMPVAVEGRPTTAVYNVDASGNPALADGARVSVRGTLDPSSKKVVARSVRVEGAESGDTAAATRIVGSLSRADKGASTLILEPRQVFGASAAAAPTQAAVTVVLGEGAVLRSRGGLLLSANEFWAAVDGKAAPKDLLVEVEGELDPTVGTLTARRARLESAGPSTAHEVVLSGAASDIDTAGRMLTLSGPLVEWDGIAAPASKEGGKGIPVVVTAATQCADAEGKYLASTSLLSAAGEADKIVRVTGLYADGKVTAIRIELRPAPARPVKEEKPAAEAKDVKPAEGGATVKPAPGAPPAEPPTGEKAPDEKPAP